MYVPTRLPLAPLAALALLSSACGNTAALTTGPADSGSDAGVDGGTDAGPDAGPVDGGLPLSAGVARVDITPGPTVPLGGYGAAPRRRMDAQGVLAQAQAARGNCPDPNRAVAASFFTANQGTLDPLYARALVLDNGQARAALIKVDAIGMTRTLHDDLLAVAIQLGIKPELFAMVATHSHSGPASLSKQFLWEMLAEDCYSEVAYQAHRNGAEQALRQAVASMKPSRLSLGQTLLRGVTGNRRGRPDVYDPALALFKVEGKDGTPIAALFNFAIHGTVLDADNLKFSADVMGAAERRIERDVPGAIAIFTNAAEGDVSPTNGFASGDTLGDTVVGLWPKATLLDPVLAGAFEDVALPHPSFHPGCMPIPGGTTSLCDLLPGGLAQPGAPFDPSWVSSKGPFKAWRIGNVALAFVPGEPLTEIGWLIKAHGTALGFASTIVVGLANDHLSYLPTRAEYERGQYEGQSTMYGPGAGELTVDAAARVLGRLPAPQ